MCMIEFDRDLKLKVARLVDIRCRARTVAVKINWPWRAAVHTIQGPLRHADNRTIRHNIYRPMSISDIRIINNIRLAYMSLLQQP
jgi:hypothetical protein